jgi:hypothetical protein
MKYIILDWPEFAEKVKQGKDKTEFFRIKVNNEEFGCVRLENECYVPKEFAEKILALL